jgi:alpha-D-ribose 1-methylphosphonate 5-triphosphate diphosphatase
LASHDDTTVEQVATSQSYGVRIAEFPTTLAAAGACHAHGMATIMGAPNLIRGGSHSGNVSAVELAQMDRLDIFLVGLCACRIFDGCGPTGKYLG